MSLSLPAAGAAAGSVVTALTAALDRAVVDPDRATARRWAVEELTRPEYVRAQPNLLQRGITWLLERLDRLLDAAAGAGTAAGLVVGLLVLAAVVVLALVVAGPVRRRSNRRPGQDGVFAGAALSAAEHREASERAAGTQQWGPAVQERFRATARALEERVVLDARPGRTADEVALEAGVLLPEAADPLRLASRAFDDVTYGGLDGDRSGYETCVAADEAVRRARPTGLLAPVGQAQP